MPVTINALGTVTPLANVTVRTQLSGQLIEIGFTEGLTLSGCSITIRDQRGRVVHSGRLTLVNGGDGLSVPTAKLS